MGFFKALSNNILRALPISVLKTLPIGVLKTLPRRVTLGLFLAGWMVVILGRLMQLQVVQHAKYRQAARAQQEKRELVPAERGTILDCNGNLLAMNAPTKVAVVNPLLLRDREFAAKLIGGILNLDSRKLEEELEAAARPPQRGFLVVAQRVSEDEKKALEGLQLAGLEIRDGTFRDYPEHQLASHVIGNVNREGHGQSGLELKFDRELSGRPGVVRVIRDAKGEVYEQEVEQPPEQGKTLKLTIDVRLEAVAEQALKEAVTENHADHGTLIAMDPYSGEIKALANYPTYDPDARSVKGDDPGRNDLAVTSPFEPGSVYKLITLSAALETTNLKASSIINCGNGVLRIGDRVVHDHNSYSSLTLEDVLAKSSNIGAIHIGQAVGNRNMYDYSMRFGVGHRTGIELPAEVPGLLRKPERWQAGSIASVAMGHEVMLTSVQLAQIAAVFANGGFRVKPHLVLSRRSGNGAWEITKPEPEATVLKPETVAEMRRMMQRVVVIGTGTRAKVLGYTTAGKTGTAQIFDYEHRVYTHRYNASFAGFVPVVNPRIVVVVTVSGTTGEAGYGGTASAPAFKKVADFAMRLIGVPRDLPDEVEKPRKPQGKQAEDDLAIAELSEPLSEEERRDSLGEEARAQASGVPDQSANHLRVPKLKGLTVREVVSLSAEQGWTADIQGKGMAISQWPDAGEAIEPGGHIEVQFRPN
jgi:cell division protein FtsI (penicillin-binding protein 3)